MVAPRPKTRLPTIPALDGIRGLGVAAILLFHAGHLRGGWLGVDLFFVLSGFLITSLLTAEFEGSGSVSLVAFWLRRARRLLPALLATLLGVCAYAALFAAPEDLERIRFDCFATLFYVANWGAIFAGFDYWDLFRAPSPLDHAWSLAIEEQFYIFWPPLVFFILRASKGSRRALLWTSVAIAVCSAAWMAYLFDPAAGTARVYFGTDTRIFATLIGAALAVALRPNVSTWPARSLPAADALALASAGILCWSWLSWDGSDPAVYRGGLLGHDIAAAALIGGSVLAPRGFASRALAWSPLRWLGRVSYGAYLWHWPLYLAMSPDRVGLEGWSLTALRIAATLVVATASYELLERPVRSGAWSPRRIGVSGGLALVAVISGTLWTTRGAPASSTDAFSSESAGFAAIESGEQSADLLMIGDSLARVLTPVLRQEAERIGHAARGVAAAGCSPLDPASSRGPSGAQIDLPHCVGISARWIDSVARLQPRVVVVVEGYPGIGSRSIAGQWLHPCQRSYDEQFAERLAALVRSFEKLGASSAIATSAVPSRADLSSRFDFLWGGMPADRLESLFRERTECLNRTRRLVAADTGARLLDLEAFLCPQGVCRRSIGETILRSDGIHFRNGGAQLVSRWMLDELSPLLEKSPGRASPGE